MFSALRRAAVKALPDRALAAYRTVRHASFFPFEPELFYVRRFLRKDALALDIGANVGLYTREMAKRAGAVMAFEPHPECARHLRRVVPANVTVVECAISDHEGVATLYSPVVGGTEHHGLARLSADGEPGRGYAVTLRPLDAIELPRMPISFVKIDVEGHELPGLRGARDTLARHRPALMVEIEYRHSPCVAETFDFMAALGYVGLRLVGGDLVPTSALLLRDAQLSDPKANNVFFLVHGTF